MSEPPADPHWAGLSRAEKARLFERLRARKGLPLGPAANAANPAAAATPGTAPEADAPIPRLVPRPHPLPLSFAQQRLWFLDRLHPGDPSYNVPAVLEIAGAFSPAALRRALADLTDRHEALRTTFAEAGERPVQVVAPALAVPLPVVDLAAVPEPARSAETERIVRAEVLQPFDLAAGPLLRALLVRREPERHVAILNLHHIVCDGWSLGVLVREVAALYAAAAAGSPAALPPLPIQYADFAVWQRQWLQGPRLERQLAFWRRQLAGLQPLRLPTDRPRPSRRGSAGGACPVAVEPAAAARLQAFARAERATPFIVLLAAWQALLGRLAGQDDVAVGTPVANRTRSETAGLIGFFVNTLVLRGDLSGDPTFRELVGRLRAVALAAFAHQDLPFERLVEELRLGRSRTPLFQALLVLQNAPTSTLAAGGLEMRDLDFPTTTAKFDLSLMMAELPDGRGFQGVLEYSAELFEATTAGGFARAFEALLEAALADPERRLSDLPLDAAGLPGARSSEPAPSPAPLSFSQERLWFLDRLTPGTATYNMPDPLRLRGPLDVAVLARCFDEVRRRHAALRTRFAEQGGTGVQIVDPWHPRPLPVVDLGGLPESCRRDEAARLTEAETAQPFDLARGPLLRTLLLRLSGEEHALLQTVHHIVSDGWSAQVMQRELTTLYAAFAAGLPSPLPDLPWQYADFARWQRQRLTGEETERQIAYWRERLGDDPPPLDLPLDRPRPPLQTFRGGRVQRRLPADLADGLRRLAAGVRGSLFMPLLAGFDLLLSRLSGQDDVLVGTPVAGRVRTDLEGLIGCFLNTLVVRADLSGNPTFQGLLGRVRDAVVGAYAHQEVPFERLLAELKPRRDLSRTPLFQVFFNLLSFPGVGASLPGGLTVEPLAGAEAESKFDLTIYAAELADGISLDLVYNAGLFDAPRMEEMLRQLAAVLAQAVANPERPLDCFSLLTPEAAALLPDPTAPQSDEWVGAVPELFAEQARRHPERPAVEDDDGTWTYGELAAAVSGLAAALRAAGIERGDRVAIWAHRSAPLAVAVLGVLEAGAAFVMLDPAYPAPRIVDMLDLARPRAWVALTAAGPVPAEVEAVLDASGVACLPVSLFSRRAVGRLGEEGRGDEGLGGRPLTPDDLAYVAFTSGSTGKPRGILGRHGSLSHFLPWTRERFRLGEGERHTMLSGLAHDPLQRDLFTSLCLGGTLCVPSPDEIGTPGRLAAWMARRGITFTNLTPAMAQILTAPPGGGAGLVAVPTLRWALLAGDVLTRRDVDRLRGVAPHAAVVNLYGSTETVRALGCHVVTESPDATGRAGQVLPLGRGMEDTQLLVLRAGSDLAGIGEVGEIFVRSPHLATGYLDDPELTAERFQMIPFTSRPGDRIYRTGDLGRYLPDGEVAFAGRRDQQVKVRGFRVELVEIEAALGRLPGVREAVVVARADDPGDRRLVAYVVPETQGHDLRDDLRGNLREALGARLPAYMVPAAFVLLDRLPVTPNLKVDRRALPAPEAAGPDRRFEPPASLMERTLAEVWAAVLKLERVGRHDDFFALGGHSLLAIQVVSRLHDRLGIEVPLAALFQAPTVESLARRLEGLGGRPAGPAPERIPHFDPEGDGPHPLSFAQERLWFLDQLTPGTATYNIPGPLNLRGPLDVAVLARCFDEVRRRHAALRTRFAEHGGAGVQIIDPWHPRPLPVVDLGALPERSRRDEAARLTEEESAWPFDLGRGPLLRTLLLRLAGDEHVLLQTVHHVVSDGWSVQVMQRELTALYAAFAAGLPSPLPELPVQYTDFARWQRQRLTGEETERQIAWWRERLGDDPPPLDLPLDRPRPPLQTFRGSHVRHRLPADLMGGLRRLAVGVRGSLFMALLAGFDLLLSRLSGQDDVLVGTPVAGRVRTDLEGLIGCFLNTLVLRADLSGNPTFQQLLSRVRDAAVGAYAHQEVPFEKLLAELKPDRDLSRTPLFQVFFNLLSFPDLGTTLPGGLTVEMLRGAEAESKFDLTVYAAETPEGIALDLAYNADLFDAPRMEEMLRQLAAVLAQAVADPETPLDRFSLLTPEAAALLPDPTAPLGDEWVGAVPELFAAQAHRHPERPAVEDGDVTWTYGELATAVSGLAAGLRAAGVERGDRVAVWAHRSAPLAVAVLGVLEAGAAFVMLDPAYPASRLVDMLDLARPRAWVALATAGPVPAEVEAFLDAGGVACLPLFLSERPRPGALTPGPSPAHAPRERGTRLEQPCWSPSSPGEGGWVRAGEEGRGDEGLGRSPLTPDDLAYIAFTSGSTGRPKGILGRHGPLTHFLPWMSERFGLGPGDRFSVLSGLAHDPLHRDLFTPLCLGGTVCFPAPGEIGTPGWLAAWMASRGITVANLTPAMGQVLTAPPGGGAALATVPSLRWAMLVGDVLTRLDADRIRRVAPRATVVNLYGSTETQRAVSFHVAAGTDAAAAGRRQVLPLGRGMKDVQLLVLRAGSGPAALAGIGEVGELCLRSPHLAAGYLGDPELTRERFQVNPFTDLPGDRLYRTGDLGRYLPDGEAAFAGRRDQQVKIRGFRVELGEVEAALGRLPGVREAVVVAREDDPGDRRLVAYVVPEEAAEPDLRDRLRDELRAALPAYMVPAAFVLLDRLPVTPNNKVDRHALPAPEAAVSHRLYEPPATVTEQALAEIWAAVLRIERAGRGDDFFALGGHSLLATQVVARIRDAFRLELPLLAVFQEPTLKGMAERIDAATATTGAAVPAIQPRRRERSAAEPLVFPLSLSQRGLWFLDQLEPGSPSYVIAMALRLTGPLDAPALRAALAEVVRRHEALRTTFQVLDGEPVQVVAPESSPLPLPLADLSILSPSSREAELLRLGAAEARRPFDLARGPLLRSTLLRLGERKHAVLVALHHIVSDAWSMGVLVGEVSALYVAFAAGRPSPLSDLPLQFPDYAEWQRDWLQGEGLDEQLAYWRDRLAGAPPLDLPADRPRRAVQRPRVGQLPVAIPSGLAERLRGVAQEHGATPFMVLLAAFQALLYRYTGQDDLVVGVPVANRRYSDLEKLIGLFVNTLALRGDLSGDPPFSALLARVREATLGAWAHQDLPLERLVAELRPERDLSRAPLFQVLFQVQNAPPPEIALASGLTLARVPLGTPQAGDYDLVVSLAESPGGLAGEWIYNTDLFDRETIERLAGHFLHLLAAACADPALPLSALPLAGEDELRQLLAWGRPAPLPDVPGGGELRRLFEAHAARSPEHPAVAGEGGGLSYGQLNARANRWAWLLRSRGVGPETRVALAAERSPEMITGLLAVLKAGGAWVPLDPAGPAERLAFLIEDSGAALLLTQRHLAARLATSLPTLLLDGEPDPAACWSEEDPPADAGTGPQNAAYVLYTSGSTGRPKGVVAVNAGLASFARAMADALRVSPADRYLQFPSLSFDASLVSIAAALAAGATLVLHPRVTELAAAELQAFCAAQGVTLVDLPAAFLRAFLGERAGRPGRLFGDAPVRALNTGGESLSRETLRQWAGLTLGEDSDSGKVGERGDTLLLNSYGPTEATVAASIFAVTAREAAGVERAIVPLGRPLPGVEVYLLDDSLRPVPPGVPGDLHLGGAGLTRGYLQRPDLTAGAFVPDPLSGRPGARLYRTGDRARWLPDGTLEFLGRRDFQVKIRGFRVELGEVEAALGRLPGVREAVVVAHEDGTGDRRLVAYVVPDGPAPAVTIPEVREALRARLPAAMVPAAFVLLERLPVTANDKVDRRALPAPEDARAGSGIAADKPSGDLERQIAGLWREVLGCERVGAHESFFDLGGHSLLAMSLLARLRDAFGVELPVRALFEEPTVAALARRVGDGLREPGAGPPPPLVPVPRDGDLPLSFGQERLWFLSRLMPGHPFYNLPGGVRLLGPLGVGVLWAALREVARRHEALRTGFVETGGQPVQVISPEPAVELPVIDLASLGDEAREAELRRIATVRARQPFDLARPGLLRTTLVRLRPAQPAEHALLYTIHHIVSDGWSNGLLASEAVALYGALARGGSAAASGLPPLPVQYADFAVWQRRWLAGEVLERQLAYWRDRLAGAPALDLPADRPRPPVQSFRGAVRRAVLPGLAAALAARARACGATPFMALLAAFQAWLLRLTGQPDVVVGAPVTNRSQRGLEELIGFFVNTLALRTDAAGDPGFAGLVSRAREVCLGAFAHQDLPFERLVEELRPARDLSRNPIFQVALNLLNTPAPRGEVDGGLTLAPLAIPAGAVGTSLFDLQAYVAEAGDDLAISWEHSTGLFDGATVARLAGGFAALLAGALAEPHLRLSALPLLAAAERLQLVVEWNDTAAAWPPDGGRPGLHHLIAAQAARTPDAPAVAAAGETLTYGELDARANRLAHRLRELGAGPESRVAVALDRSLELVVALLATLKAGAAYVPLDPDYPRQRLAFMLADSRPALVLTRAALRASLPEPAVPLLCLEPEGAGLAELADTPAVDPAVPVAPAQLAYVIYTSGSTGQPKGAMVHHQAIRNRLLWMQETYELTAADTVLQKTPFSFDVSVWELFWPLLAGARLVLAAPGEHRDAAALAARIVREGVTVLHFVPSMLQVFLEEPRAADCRSVRLVVASGEALPPALARRCRERLPGALLDNLYGPTEAAVDVTWHRCSPADGRTVPIGRPIANTAIHLVDRDLRPVPVGATGELLIGGANVGRGYLGQSGLTAEKFVPNPFATTAGARLYRTGDLARRLPDGRVDYLGRSDHQVKVRGVRIELGEVERALTALPSVREAVVSVRGEAGSPGSARLIAWLVPERGTTLSPELLSALRDDLARQLPDALIPAVLVPLESLPLSPSGKVDRRSLPDPEPGRATVRELVPPRDSVEQAIAGLWQRLLGLETVGVHDNFFELGGHSLLGTRVIAALREEFGVEIPLRFLFEKPTIADLALAVAQARVDRSAAAEVDSLLDNLEDLSDEEVEALLAAQGGGETL